MNGDTAARAAVPAPTPEAAPTSLPHIRQGTPEFRRASQALFASGFATFGLLYCVQPLLPEFSKDFGVSAAGSALALSVSTGVLAVAMIFAGILSDRVGRRPVMAVSLLASSVLMLLVPLMHEWHAVLLLRTLLGLSLSGVPAVAMTWLAEEMDAGSLGLGMGLYIGGNAVGGMSGRLIAGVVADYWGWRAGVATVGCIGLIATAVFWSRLPVSRHFVPRQADLRALPASFADLFCDGGLPWLFALGFVLLGVFVTMYNYLGYHLLAPPYRLSQTVVGLIFTVYLIGSFSSAWMGQLAGRIGRARALGISLGLILVGVALLALPQLWVMALGITLVTFGFFGGHSVASSWVGSRGGQHRAEASALYLFGYYLGSSVAGAVGGVFYTSHGWAGVCAFGAVLTLVGLGLVWRLTRLRSAHPVTMPAAG
ncbi:MAG TPA: MFS transporter, partial [Xanthomonadaceae bacterium]|nr:MFS transporter [Xanthomonadaceae bacterium]